MRALIVPALLAIQQGGAFLFGPAPSPSRMAASTRRTEPAVSAHRPRATTAAFTSLRSREDGNADADKDVEGFVNSLKSSGLLGENGGAGVTGLGDGGGANGLAAAASDAAADLEEPGKLVREAAKPFREEMDRIEADFQRNISEKEEEIERKLEEMMKKIVENK